LASRQERVKAGSVPAIVFESGSLYCWQLAYHWSRNKVDNDTPRIFLFRGIAMRWFIMLVVCGLFAPCGCRPPESAAEPPKKTQFGEDRVNKSDDSKPKPAEPPTPFDGARAVKYVKQLCDIGPRVSGSEGMTKQIELLVKHFEGLGGSVTKQEFQASQRSQAGKVSLTNLIVSWFPERTSRIILCAHTDTRPYADQEQDKKSWNKPFVSANDGASGVAFLMELAHHMKEFPTQVGVDFVLFDGEEYVFRGPDGNDEYFLGSTYFATEYKNSEKTRKHRYTAAILFDLFAHEGANIKIEDYSWQYSNALVLEVWKIADDLKAKSFKFNRGFERGSAVLDDHVPLIQAGIPAIDLLDFDYEHWHKLSDTPDKCSPKQMAEVANVVTTWMKGLKTDK
jgi:glutaminyl-peptide cyclotransferase